MLQERIDMKTSVGQINLKRYDFEERKSKVQLGGNFKQPMVRKLSQEESDD
jgi:hypothetical protein